MDLIVSLVNIFAAAGLSPLEIYKGDLLLIQNCCLSHFQGELTSRKISQKLV